MAMICIHGGECDGCMACQDDQEEYYCPVCGEKTTEDVYVSIDGDILGCENCVTRKDPWDVLEK
jgi:predicted amidophosphoribosyltransferase